MNAALAAPSSEDAATSPGPHADAEPVAPLAPSVVRLIRALHDDPSSSDGCAGRFRPGDEYSGRHIPRRGRGIVEKGRQDPLACLARPKDPALYSAPPRRKPPSIVPSPKRDADFHNCGK